MTSENPTQWTEVKKVKFHHKVKRFYHKNLFRKIYTVAIIGLIGANVFSMVKYASFADEALVNESSTENQEEVVVTMGPVDSHGVADYEDNNLESDDSQPKEDTEDIENTLQLSDTSEDNRGVMNTSSDGCYQYNVLDEDAKTVEITRYTCDNTNITIPSMIDGYTVISIYNGSYRNGAFYGKNITNVIIPNTITSIGDYAFYDNKLTSVVIPDSVTNIGNSAFKYNQLTSVTIPDSVTSIGDYAFYTDPWGSYVINSVHIGKNVEYIGNNAFGELCSTMLFNKMVNQRITFEPGFDFEDLEIGNDENKEFCLYSDDGCFRFDVANKAILRYMCTDSTIEIPEKIAGWNVERIAPSYSDRYENRATINNDTNLVILPNTVVEIGEGAACMYGEDYILMSLGDDGENMVGVKPKDGQTLSPSITSDMLNDACMYLAEPHEVKFYDDSNNLIKTTQVEGRISSSDFPKVGRKFGIDGTWVDEEGREYYGGSVIWDNIVLHISYDKGITHDDDLGMIAMKYGEGIVYIKDRNVGATKSLGLSLNNYYNYLNNSYNNGEISKSDADEMFMNYMNNFLGTHYTNPDDALNYYRNEYNENDYEAGSNYSKSFGNYYFRGNNTGATYAELNENGWQMTNYLYNKGFDGGKYGTSYDEWKQGNTPCDESEGEYMPSGDDWAKAIRVWSNIKGYDLDESDWNSYGWLNYYDSEFGSDILLPNAGYIGNGGFETDSLSVNSFEIGENLNFNWDDMLWSTFDSSNKIGYLNRYYLKVFGNDTIDVGGINKNVMPVRCFIDPDYINSIVKYEVTYMDGEIEIATWPVVSGSIIKDKYIPATPRKAGYTFDGWYTEEGTKWNFDTDTVKGTMTLYAKWKVCGEGYNVVGNKCIPDNIEGIITVTDGTNTMFIRDRNVGVNDAAVKYLKMNTLDYMVNTECQNSNNPELCWNTKGLDKFNEAFGTQYTSMDEIDELYNELLLEVLEGVLPEKEMEAVKFAEIKSHCTTNYAEYSLGITSITDDLNINRLETDLFCMDSKILPYVNQEFNQNFDDVDDARDYLDDYFGDDVDLDEVWNNYYYGYYGNLADKQPDGNYYYRGNNSGVSYNELEFGYDENDNWVITNMTGLQARGFSGGKIGVEGEGWIEGNPNPCDASKGEYLPTPEGWKNLMEIWGNANGHRLGGDEYNYDYNGTDYIEYEYELIGPEGMDKLQSDLLLPYGGYIYETTCGNDEEPCIEWKNDDFGLRASQDSEGKMGVYQGGWVYYTHYNVRLDDGYRPDNTEAVPVRCFVNLPEVLSITFISNGGSEVNDMNVISGDTVSLPTPTKTNYTFAGWYTDRGLAQQFTSSTPVTEDITLYAKWTESSTPTNNGGSSSRPHKTDKDETHASAEETQTDNTKEDTKTDDQQGKTMAGLIKSEITVKDTVVSNNATYTPEQNKAYQFAKSNGITTTSSIKEAKMNTPLTRIQMAKMLSQYAMNVLGKTPDHSAGVVNFKDVTNKMNKDYDNAVTLAYQLGIMGINMPNREFRPNDTVTRAEFATALSRMIYGIEDGKGKTKYYEPHMARLYNEGIITNTNPNMLELRGYVMTMLMRTVQ